jgi:hypothetical protein
MAGIIGNLFLSLMKEFPLWYLSVDFASIAIKLIAHAVAVATLTSFGIWRMLRAGDLVSLVSPRPASIVATEEIRPVD